MQLIKMFSGENSEKIVDIPLHREMNLKLERQWFPFAGV